jgi:phospholipid/cholesterol/gamma-HCH transport system substrate-binding protein
MEERNLEIKVGLLVLVAGLLLAGFIFVMGAFTFEDRFEMYVDFENPLWIAPGAVVKVSGTKAGTVEEISFLGGEFDPKVNRRVYVRIKLAVATRVRGALRSDAKFYIANQGLLGEQYIEIEPGSPEAPPMDPSIPMVGVDPPRLEKFLLEGYEIVSKVGRILDAPDEALGGLLTTLVRVLNAVDEVLAENRGSLKTTVDNLAALTDEARDLVSDARGMLAPDGRVDGILADVKNVTEDLPERLDFLLGRLNGTVDRADRLFARLDHVVEDTLGDVQRRQLRNTIANVETVSERAVTVADDISALTTDVRGEIDPVVTDVRRAIEQVRTILADAEEIVRTIRRGEGTVGALLMDEQIFDDLKELIRDLKHNPWKFFWRE